MSSNVDITHIEDRFTRGSADRRQHAREPDLGGAMAALETFYHSFNNQSLEAFDAVWAESSLISLNNPLGGIMRGIDDIRSLYRGIYEGPVNVWVEFSDIVVYSSPGAVTFAGRETGEFSRDGRTVNLNIRTSRLFIYFGPDLGWRQVHHHGSIDNADALREYQDAVRSN